MMQYTPPMGWNTWNTFGEHIDEDLIRASADALVESGLADAGYRYVVIDDCWALRHRDENGKMVPDPKKFPSGMKALGDYIHSKGLLFGMYSCAGNLTCAGFPGSYDHEFEDAKMFAEWGIDFLKYDYCYHTPILPAVYHYRRMGAALSNCGRDILFSACSWGFEDTHQWVKSTGAQMWRSTGDIVESWNSIKEIALKQDQLYPFNGVGCFNDMDMLVVGLNGKGTVGREGGLSLREYRTHFSIWCLLGSPLMVGCDIRSMSDEVKAILTNREAIAINQDIACRQPYQISTWSGNPENMVRAKLLSNGDYAIGMFNLCDSDSQFVCAMDELGLPNKCGKRLVLRDVWSGETILPQNGTLQAMIPPHDCLLMRGHLEDA